MDNRLQISRILHAGYIFQAGSTKILFDPIFENPFSVNCFAFPETRFDIKEIKSLKADAVFISHFHEDHCSFESLQHLDRDIPIYMFCVNPEMFDLIKQLGFSSVQSVELEKPLYIHGFTITPHRALDVEVDCIYQIQYQDIQVLNVVDSWIVDEKLQELIKISWDLILWPFQTMRELEVLSPGTDLKCSPEIPQEWLSQIQALNPKALVPSSCQFKFEKNSWYNSYFFPISYRFFEDELKRICPDTAFMCLNPGKTWLLDKTQGRLSFQDGLDVSWIKISGDENEDYAFNPSVEIPSLQSLARNDPALSIKQLQDLKAYCTKGILQRYAELDPDVYPYFFKERIWLLKVIFSHDILWQEIQTALQSGARIYSLLNFDLHKGNYGDVVEPYQRLKHFKTWIFPEGDCRNTRALVLTDTSEVPVKMNSSGCTVSSGSWQDPYSGKTLTNAQDTQIDHFVPLKNAYISGADRWTLLRRCQYANYRGNNFHLIPVLGHENTKKSDRSPEGYMPPNRAYACTYLAQWLKVKLIWSLELSSSEKSAIENLVQKYNCTAAELTYTNAQLDQQRQEITKTQDICR